MMDGKKIVAQLVKLAEDLQDSPPWTYSVTYSRWDEEALEAGDTDDKGFEIEDAEVEDLEELLSDVEGIANWVEWSSSPPDGHSWIISEGDQDPSGEITNYALHIKRPDGQPLSKNEIATITKHLGLHGLR